MPLSAELCGGGDGGPARRLAKSNSWKQRPREYGGAVVGGGYGGVSLFLTSLIPGPARLTIYRQCAWTRKHGGFWKYQKLDHKTLSWKEAEDRRSWDVAERPPGVERLTRAPHSCASGKERRSWPFPEQVINSVELIKWHSFCKESSPEPLFSVFSR